MIDAEALSIPERIALLIRSEVAEEDRSDPVTSRMLDAFETVLCPPHRVTVTFSGGLTQSCWQVTRSDGDYAVVYMPRAGYFALCVMSALGPLDIGVHGPALGCFASV